MPWASVPSIPCVSPPNWPQTPISYPPPLLSFPLLPLVSTRGPRRDCSFSACCTLTCLPVFARKGLSAWNACSLSLQGTCQCPPKLSVEAACSGLPWHPVHCAVVSRVLCKGLGCYWTASSRCVGFSSRSSLLAVERLAWRATAANTFGTNEYMNWRSEKYSENALATSIQGEVKHLAPRSPSQSLLPGQCQSSVALPPRVAGCVPSHLPLPPWVWTPDLTAQVGETLWLLK